MRLNIQWLKESNEPERSVYEDVVFEFEIPRVGEVKTPAITKVLIGENYKNYTGWLDINAFVDRQLYDQNLPDILPANNDKFNCDAEILEYYGTCEKVDIESYTINDEVDVRPWWDRRPDPVERVLQKYEVLESEVVAETEFIDVKFRFHTLKLDPVGESKVWFRWVFFNDDVSCWNWEGTCLTDKPPTDGQIEPYHYSTYFYWSDFFDREQVEVLMWTLVITSFLGILGFYVEFVLCQLF